MESVAETLWQEFAAETDEHLGGLEPMLVRLGESGGAAAAQDVAALFRSFHSVKGLARAMGLHGMEAVAHRAESLLGLVRDHGAATSEAMLDALVEAVDCLRGMREAAVAERRDGAAPAALLNRLDALVEEAGGASGGRQGAADPQPAVPADHAAELHEDAEMLGLFVELLQTRLPELARALSADAQERADALDTLESLQHAADVMHFEPFAEGLGELHAFLAEKETGNGGLAAAEDWQRAVALLDRVRLQAELLGEITGADAGAAALAQALVEAAALDRAALAGGLVAAVHRLEAGAIQEDAEAIRAAAGAAAAAAHQARAVTAGAGAPRAVEVLLLLEDVFRRAAQDGLTVTPPLAALLHLVARTVADGAGDGADLGDAAAADLMQQVRLALMPMGSAAAAALREGGGAGSDSGAPARELTVGGLHMRPEMLAVLSAENVHEIIDGVAAGAYAYELLLHIEGSPSAGEALLGWLTTEAKIVTNRTVIVDGQSWFDVLFLSEHPPAPTRSALVGRDPERRCVKALRRLNDNPAGEPILGPDAAAKAAAAPGVTPAGAPLSAGAAPGTTVLRVRSDVIDRLMTQISEVRAVVADLIDAAGNRMAADSLAQMRRVRDVATGDGAVALAKCIEVLQEQQRVIGELSRTVDTSLRRLQSAALELRVVPVEVILNRMPRVVRMLAQEQGKNVQLLLEGRDVRVDKSMVERLVDPLMHMVRNAIDHGVEPPEQRVERGKPARATLTIRALQRGSEVQIQISDDGRGLDDDAILSKAIARGVVGETEAARLKPHEIHRFIFAPGFSTAAEVTETSGRGVGMDVVLTTVQQLGGDIDVETERGVGTTFTLRLPLSAAIQMSLLVRVAGQVFGIPERFVASVIEAEPGALTDLGSGLRTIAHSGVALPVYRLADLLWREEAGAGGATAGRSTRSIVVIASGPDMIGLEVDRVRRRQELFLKDLHPLLAGCPAVSGAAMLGNGRIVLLLDGDELIQLARNGSWRRHPPPSATAAGEAAE